MRIVTHFFPHNDQKREFEAITDMPGQTKVQKVVSVSFFLKYISACKNINGPLSGTSETAD